MSARDPDEDLSNAAVVRLRVKVGDKQLLDAYLPRSVLHATSVLTIGNSGCEVSLEVVAASIYSGPSAAA